MQYGYSTGGSATVNDAPYDATFFKHYGVNPFIDTEDDHLSTFAMDVDTASYTVARRFLRDGHLPEPDSIRVEEFVNFFKQGYELPEEEAFAIHVEGSPSPFGGPNHWLVRVGLQGRSVEAEERKDATLIFVIDVSGSMARENRLGLVKSSLGLLVNELRPADRVGIVVYGSRGRVLLEPIGGGNKDAIMESIHALRPGGSTNAAEGLLLGYGMAVDEVQSNRITRLILLSDGVANVGRTGPESIFDLVKDFVEEGVTLSAVGFGMGNYNDILMEQLANNGDGNYSYVDTLDQARRIFVENLTGTLQVIARDAKVQVDFNPEVVSRYRLLGYENRRVADQDFRNDAVDAGEIGAGHSVTALYELKLLDSADGNVATVSIRYQEPDIGEVVEMSREIARGEIRAEFEEASPRFQLAATVAEYAEILRESYWAQDGSIEDVLVYAERVRKLLPDDSDVAEFVEMVSLVEPLTEGGQNIEDVPIVEQFPIDEARAIEIAREAGLEPGVRPWRTNYSSHPTEGNVWSVENTLHESSGGADGRLVRIDANTGGVIEFSNWAIAVEEEGILLIKATREYEFLLDKYGPGAVSVEAVNLHDKTETEFLRKIDDGFLLQPGCIIVLKAGKGEGYVYQLDEGFNIVFRITLSEFEQGARNVDARTMEHFYRSLK